MRLQRSSPKKSLSKIISYVKVCCILHNMLLDDEVEEYEDDDLSLIDADNVLNRPVPTNFPRNSRREELKNYIIENYFV